MLLLILLLKGVFIYYHDAKYVSMMYASVYQCISAFRRLTLMRYLYFRPNLSTKMFIIYDLGGTAFCPQTGGRSVQCDYTNRFMSPQHK